MRSFPCCKIFSKRAIIISMNHFNTFLDTSFEEAVAQVTDAFKEEGMGVLTEMDVQTTLKKKFDVNFRKYKILDACYPY